MTWAQAQREAWIAHRLRRYGWIRRACLMTEFGISEPQASIDLRAFAGLYLGAMAYDGSAKRYQLADASRLPAEPPQERADREELAAAHARLNEIGVPNVDAPKGHPESARVLTLAERLAFVISTNHHFSALEHEAIRLREEIEPADDHACFTGDCPHDNANECVAVLRKWASSLRVRELPKTAEARP